MSQTIVQWSTTRLGILLCACSTPPISQILVFSVISIIYRIVSYFNQCFNQFCQHRFISLSTNANLHWPGPSTFIIISLYTCAKLPDLVPQRQQTFLSFIHRFGPLYHYILVYLTTYYCQAGLIWSLYPGLYVTTTLMKNCYWTPKLGHRVTYNLINWFHNSSFFNQLIWPPFDQAHNTIML